jgi:hypothetical protein
LNRYESAIFTCRRFAFGQSTYDKVLANYSTPMTFDEYMLLSKEDQSSIEHIVEERTVGRLMIKDSMNEQLRDHLVQTFSVNNDTCYPNTISDAGPSSARQIKKIIKNYRDSPGTLTRARFCLMMLNDWSSLSIIKPH